MKIVARNTKAKSDYEITEKLVAGIALRGAEVKSTKAGHMSLKGSFVNIQNDELWLINAHISPYQYANNAEYNPTRTRKLLVHNKELKKLAGFKQGGLSIVPISAGIERGFIKIELGIGRGRKKFDKRERQKKQQAEREIAKAKKLLG